MTQRTAIYRMQIFAIVWVGQLVSLIGSGLTSFALGVWVYQRTGSVTQFALISLSIILPSIVVAPIAGVFVDRWDRRQIMLIGDSGASLSTLVIAILLFVGHLEIWHIYLATAVSSACKSIQMSAYTAATTLLVPKEYLGRANGLVYLGQSLAQLLSPILAGVLVVTIQIQGVILLDFITFLVSLVTLLLVQFPKYKNTSADVAEKSSVLHEAAYGWNYVAARPGLLGLMIFLTATNFLISIVEVLVTPLVLSFASTTILGIVLSVGGSGMVFGSLAMSYWGGSQRHINNVFYFMLLSGLSVLVAGLRPEASLCALAAFLFFFSLPIINSSILVIFQKKVAPNVQGRVFTLTETVTMLFRPLAYIIAGPLADRIFEPLLAPGGFLVGTVGQIIGVGQGRGVGLLFIVTGILTMLVTVAAFQYPPLRLVEKELPDAT